MPETATGNRPAGPEFVTHYYRSSRQPFLNLSDLADDDAIGVMAKMIEERRQGLQQRPLAAGI